MSAADAAKPMARGWRLVLANLRQPKVLAMLLLGFSSGIPIYLVGNTLSYWMRDNGIELSTIGFLSWVGLAYSLKFLWAPLVDKARAPLFGRWLGRRRGWMLLSQLVAAVALVGMAVVRPDHGEIRAAGFVLNQLLVFGALALVVAFASATQDIVIDAWRIESADDAEQQGLLTSTGLLGYRGALLVTDSLILIFAAHIGWSISYVLMAVLLGVGVAATLLAREPQAPPPVAAAGPGDDAPLGVSDAMVLRWLLAGAVGLAWLAYAVMVGVRDALAMGWGNAPWLLLPPLLVGWLTRWPGGPVAEATWSRPLVRPLLRMRDAVIEPFLAFFRQHGRWALVMLLAISLYRLPDFLMGPMANPLYADLGLSKEMVGTVRGSVGLLATTVGIAVAGLSAVRFGFMSTLLVGAVLGPGSNLAFSWLAMSGGDHGVFTAAMVIDNFCTGFASVALVGYMSSLTNIGYTATQYALLSSFYALLGKVLKGFSGATVEHLEVGRSLHEAYALFFTGTALMGVPALLLCLWLALWRPRHARAQAG